MSVNAVRRSLGITAAVLAMTAMPVVATATAAPVISPDQLPTAGAPMEPAPGQYSYIATHAVTRQAQAMKVADGIASMPVPLQYRPANLALAAQFDSAVTGALRSPGGCLQVIVDPNSKAGNLFNYGFFPVAGRYCE